jgi:hypothetical protein
MARTPNLRQNAPKPAAPKPISLPKVQSIPFTGNSGHPKIPSRPQAITGDAARAQVRADMDSHRLPTPRADGVEKVRHDVALHAVRRQMEGNANADGLPLSRHPPRAARPASSAKARARAGPRRQQD